MVSRVANRASLLKAEAAAVDGVFDAILDTLSSEVINDGRPRGCRTRQREAARHANARQCSGVHDAASGGGRASERRIVDVHGAVPRTDTE